MGADGTLLSRQVFPKELSANVQKTIAQLQRYGPVGDVYWTDDDGEFSYAVEVTLRGKKQYFALDLNGWLQSTPLNLNEIPLAFQKAIQTQLGQGTIISIDRVDDYGRNQRRDRRMTK